MKNTFIWRNRVVIVSGALLIISAHMLSRGPRLDPFAARPSAWVLDLIQLPELAATQIGEDTAGVVKDYLDLVGVRRETSRLQEARGKRPKRAAVDDPRRSRAHVTLPAATGRIYRAIP